MNKRAIDVLNFRKTDRLPAVHFGYWSELLDEWEAEGHISRELKNDVSDGSNGERKLDVLLGWDHNWCNLVGGDMGLRPKFEEKVLERYPDGFYLAQNGDGVVQRVKVGAEGIPGDVDYLLKDRESYEKHYRKRMEYSDLRVDKKFFEHFKENAATCDYPIGVSAGSVLGSLRNIFTLVGMSYLLCDDFELVDEIVTVYADMQYKTLEAVLKTGARFDFAHYWEDICYTGGPLISPTVFEKLCAKHYARRNALLKSYGIELISLDCDGVIGSLLPIWLESGVNVMFPLEIGTWGDQFFEARKRYGDRVRGVGGVDKRVLCVDKTAVDREIERLKPLIALGGFLPCPDHRLMPGTKWELVQYYADKIKELKL